MASVTFTFYNKDSFYRQIFFLESSAIQKYYFLFGNQILSSIIRVDRINSSNIISRVCTHCTTIINPTKFKVFDKKKSRFFLFPIGWRPIFIPLRC